MTDSAAKSLCTSDPMERLIEAALIAAGIRYTTESDGSSPHRLDFDLPDIGVAIEVKRFHSPRAVAQLGRTENVILVQGEKAVRALAAFIVSGSHSEHRP